MKNLDLRINGKYQLQRRIGGGGFGTVYIGNNIATGEEVAIKLEHVSIDPSLLEAEANVYRSLSGGAGIPRVHAFLFECEYNAMVFDLLGPSLEDLFNFCGRRFSLKTVLMLADQLLHRLEHMHSKDIIHRDVKPENFLMGTGRCGNVVYVTDMGLATERREHQIQTDPIGVAKRHLIGTTRFASINGHLGILQDRSDDLESLGYMLLYFLRASLPWQGVKAEDQTQEEEMILETKRISTENLCIGLPKEFEAYFDHIRSLSFDQIPAYAYLHTKPDNIASFNMSAPQRRSFDSEREDFLGLLVPPTPHPPVPHPNANDVEIHEWLVTWMLTNGFKTHEAAAKADLLPVDGEGLYAMTEERLPAKLDLHGYLIFRELDKSCYGYFKTGIIGQFLALLDDAVSSLVSQPSPPKKSTNIAHIRENSSRKNKQL